jgi:hypothetical protein
MKVNADATSARQAAARKVQVASALDLLVQQRRCSPPLRDLMLVQLTAEGVTDEQVADALKKMAALPATAVPISAVPVQDTEGEVTYIEAPSYASLLAELGYRVNPDGVALEARARAAANAETDPEKSRRVYLATLEAGLDGGQRSANRLPFAAN